jgi:hypothetical protein
MLKFTVPLSLEQFTEQQLQLNDTLKYNDDNNNNNNNINEGCNKKQRTVINWFQSPFIHDILAAYKLHHSGFKTVKYLQQKFPKLDTEEHARFQFLNDSTIDNWFNSEHQLLPQYQALLNHNWLNPKGAGRHAILAKHPELVEKIKQTLLDMRRRNISVKIRQARIVFTAMIKLHQPELLNELKLSKTFLSDWCRTNLSWRYRKVTCNYDKLPIDWEQQGKL